MRDDGAVQRPGLPHSSLSAGCGHRGKSSLITHQEYLRKVEQGNRQDGPQLLLGEEQETID